MQLFEDRICGGGPLEWLAVCLVRRDEVIDALDDLGHISKQGDRYLRMLLTHGVRSVLRAATAAVAKGKALTPLREWAIGVQARTKHNKATCALANELARVCFTTRRDHAVYDDSATVQRKMQRQSFVMPA